MLHEFLMLALNEYCVFCLAAAARQLCPEARTDLAASVNWWVLFVCIITTRALLFGVYFRALEFSKMPFNLSDTFQKSEALV